MPEEYNKTLKYNEEEKSMKSPFIIDADLECLLQKINTCHNNPEESSATKINKHTPSSYSLFTHCSFNTTKNKLDYSKGKHCMKNFCLDLRKIINYEKKEMILLTKKEEKKHKKQKVCYICKKGFSTRHCRRAAQDNCNLRYKIPKEIPEVFHNGSTYDYHFIIKELADEFEGEFECLGENTEKYITFPVTIKKEITKKDKNSNDKITKISYKIKFIDSYRFMSASLSNLVSNLSEGLHNDRCIDCKSCLDYMTTKDEQLIFRCFRCKANYEKNFNKDFIQRFTNIYEFCNGDLNKFIL